MATAEEILSTMAEETAGQAVEAEACTIDRCTRAVGIPADLKIVGVETDKDVTRREFKVLCSYRGTDLSTFGIRIHFMNANKEKDAYIVTDAAKDGEYLSFSWLMSRKALKYKGKLQFAVCMICEGGTDSEREWNSTLGEFQVLEGLEVDFNEEEEEEARDVLAQLLSLVDAQKDTAIAAVKAEGTAQVSAVDAAGAQQRAAIEVKGAATLATIPEDYAATYNRAINSAVAIPDESALSASHELHAQRDYPLNVAVYGYTYQEGEGDPSPDNVRPIHGLDAAQVRAGGKNLLKAEEAYAYKYGDLPIVQILNKGETMQLAKTINGRPCAISFDIVASGVEWDESGKRRVGIEACIENTSAGVQNYDIGLWALSDQIPATGSYRATKTHNPIDIVDGFDNAYPLNMYFQGVKAGTVTIKNLQIELNTSATPYEPYCANTADLPLLPDNSPLMEGDTVENWVRSWCDKKVVLDGSTGNWHGTNNWFHVSSAALGISVDTDYPIYSATLKSGTNGAHPGSGGIAIYPSGTIVMLIDGVEKTTEAYLAYLAANPLTVYYRSTDYTPDKDLRVCRVVRNYRSAKISDFAWQTEGLNASGLRSFYAPAIGTVYANGAVQCEKLPSEGAHWQAVNNNIYSDKTTNRLYIIIKPDELEAGIGIVEALVAAVGDATVVYRVKEETYMTDPLPLLPPAALESETVTVTGSGETKVDYAHETKHYIDTAVAGAVAVALAKL